MSSQAQRLDWVDASRAVAILLIYCGHWTPADSRLAVFAYLFHLQYFFFASGFFYHRQKELGVLPFVARSVQRILVPLFFFGFLNIVFFNLSGVLTLKEMGAQVVYLLKGAQTGFTALQLWFLASLFCTQVIYHILSRLIRNPLIVLALSVVAFFVAKASPKIPELYYHLNTVPFYLVYFAAGDVFFRWYTARDSLQAPKWLPAAFGGSLLFAFLVYSGGATFFTQWGIPAPRRWWSTAGYELLMVFGLFVAVIAAAQVGAQSSLILDIGRNTLILLGVELLIKKLFLHMTWIFHLPVNITTALDVVIFSVVVILLARMIFFRLLNDGLPWAVGKPTARRSLPDYDRDRPGIGVRAGSVTRHDPHGGGRLANDAVESAEVSRQ